MTRTTDLILEKLVTVLTVDVVSAPSIGAAIKRAFAERGLSEWLECDR